MNNILRQYINNITSTIVSDEEFDLIGAAFTAKKDRYPDQQFPGGPLPAVNLIKLG